MGGVAFFLGILALSSFISDRDSNRGCLAVKVDDLNFRSEVAEVSGSVRNSCGRNFSAVIIRFRALDGAGAIVGHASDSAGALRKGETWHFKATGIANGNVQNYQLESVKGY